MAHGILQFLFPQHAAHRAKTRGELYRELSDGYNLGDGR